MGHIRGVAEMDGVRLEAVCDPLAAARGKMADEFGIGRRNERTDEMLEHAELDAVLVNVPPHLNAEAGVSLVVVIVDDSLPFDLGIAPERDLDASLEDTALSGLGRVMDANGHDIAVAGTSGRVVYWETSNSAVVRVAGERRRDGYETGATATVTAVTAGTATITARPGGKTVEGTATITVATPQ